MIKNFLAFTLIFLLFPSCENKSQLEGTYQSKETPLDIMFAQRAYPSGLINSEAYREAIKWKKEQTKKTKNPIIWEFVGPTNIGGRINDIEIPIDQAETYYIGAASGGIFKTTDAGYSWNPIFDNQSMMSIGDMEISKQNTETIWVGTGEVNAGGGSLAYDGDGVYVSKNGGIDWNHKGLSAVGSIGKVLINPEDENTILVAAMGPLFKNDSNRGIYRTINGGETWENVLFINDSTGVIDMAIHPTDGNIVYAASWERIRRPNYRKYGGAGSGLHKSKDGGLTWSELTVGLPTNPNQKGRISIAISQSNPNVLYSRYTDATGNIQGVYKSTDGGDSWESKNITGLTDVGFHWWFRGIFIDPKDENTIYNVDFIVEKSTNGGNTWSETFEGVHVDQHALAFNNSKDSEVLLGNDGGLYYSQSNGANPYQDLELPITQFYRIQVDPQNDKKIYGGAQDNGTLRTTNGTTNNWSRINGGDGFQPLVDPKNTDIIFAASQYGNLRKSTNNASTFVGAINGIPNGDRKNWDTPVMIDPNNNNTMYYGSNRLYKSTNAADSWDVISQDLSNGPYAGGLVYGSIISIDVSPLDEQVIYIGTDDGNIWKTLNGGNSYQKISDDLPNRWVTKVLASRDDKNVVYASFSGYRYGKNEGHVYKSQDQGETWSDISTDLPNIPVNDILKDKLGNLYLGTDIGVMVSSDEGENWQILDENLPSVPVTDMYIHESTDYLYVGTYGRSIYKLDISKDVTNVKNDLNLSRISIYPNPSSDFIHIAISDKSELPFELEIIDQLGRTISKENYNHQPGQDIIYDLKGLSDGVYYFRIEQNQKVGIEKIIVRK